MELITGFLIKYGIELAIGSVGSVILGWILGKIPTGKWAKQMGDFGEKKGQTVTTFCQKKVPLWNKVFEPVFIDTINVVLAFFAGFIRGLKLDNQESKNSNAD